MALVSPEKAGEILEHGTVRGKALTPKQIGFFGLRRAGKRPTRLKGKKRDRRLEPK